MRPDFLLTSSLSREIYQSIEDLPLMDWHNHLSWQDLGEDRRYENLTQLWVTPDPYKHRAMRILGVPEEKITGQATDWERFQAWSAALPQLVGNPLYHWSRLELSRFFHIQEELTPESAERIWCQANERLGEAAFSARGLLRRMKVEYAAPCVTPGEDARALPEIPGVVPSFRGDDLLQPSGALWQKLARQAGRPLRTLEDFRQGVTPLLDALHRRGCRFADHALDGEFLYQSLRTTGETPLAFGDEAPPPTPALASAILRLLMEEYARRHWTVQLHLGALRSTSTRLRAVAGAAGGYAGIGRGWDLPGLAALLDDVEQSPQGLPECILYPLNPADCPPLANLSGAFPGDGLPGKVQLGPAWWWCDHIRGIRECLEASAAYGVLSVSLGMTTDSRSLLSFVRHEYYRRILASWLAEKAAKGEFPSRPETLAALAAKLSYGNIKEHLLRKEPWQK
ncbi:MAG: glucuronate isomerase [Oligosphaeraceae bacterium]